MEKIIQINFQSKEQRQSLQGIQLNLHLDMVGQKRGFTHEHTSKKSNEKAMEVIENRAQQIHKRRFLNNRISESVTIMDSSSPQNRNQNLVVVALQPRQGL